MTNAVFYDTDFASKDRWLLFLKLIGVVEGQGIWQGNERVEIVEMNFDETPHVTGIKVNPAELIEGKLIRFSD